MSGWVGTGGWSQPPRAAWNLRARPPVRVETGRVCCPPRLLPSHHIHSLGCQLHTSRREAAPRSPAPEALPCQCGRPAPSSSRRTAPTPGSAGLSWPPALQAAAARQQAGADLPRGPLRAEPWAWPAGTCPRHGTGGRGMAAGAPPPPSNRWEARRRARPGQGAQHAGAAGRARWVYQGHAGICSRGWAWDRATAARLLARAAYGGRSHVTGCMWGRRATKRSSREED